MAKQQDADSLPMRTQYFAVIFGTNSSEYVPLGVYMREVRNALVCTFLHNTLRSPLLLYPLVYDFHILAALITSSSYLQHGSPQRSGDSCCCTTRPLHPHILLRSRPDLPEWV